MTLYEAVLVGIVAGAFGTVVMDLVWFARYRVGGGDSTVLSWEFSSRLDSWDGAPAPALVGRSLVETMTRHPLAPRHAATTNNVVHWGYGMLLGATYGVLGWAALGHNPVWGLGFGLIVWLSSYITLPLMGLYRPIWAYDARTLFKDLTAHLAFGLGTSVAFALLAR